MSGGEILPVGSPHGAVKLEPVTYPRTIETVHQVEITTFCNLRCVYCPSPKLEKIRGQEKQHMSLATFKVAMEWAAFFDARGTQKELSLTGIGESLLHPELPEIIRLARETLPERFINFSTNGIGLTDDICKVLARYGVGVYVSLHRPEKAGLAIEMLRKHGLFMAANAGAAVSSFDWGGQVDWPVSAPSTTCDWLLDGWCNVLVDGRITTCCFDAAAGGVVGSVFDKHLMGELGTRPHGLCETCHLNVP